MAGKRRGPSEETKFLRGETGVDGAAIKEEADPAELEQAKAQEALLRGRTWLGRECLTWLLWKSESTEPVTKLDDVDVTVVFNGRLTLRAGGGDVTEVVVKGVTSPYSKLVKAALKRGLLVHGAKVQLTWGEQVYDVSLDAEFFDVKGAKLPQLMQEEDSERLTERLELAGRLSHLVDALTQAFIKARLAKSWDTKTVVELVEWMKE